MNVKITVEATELTKAFLALAEAIKESNVKSSGIKGGQDFMSIRENIGVEQAEVQEEPPKDESAVTLEFVRKTLAEKTRAGKQSEVKSLITKFGANKLTEVDPALYSTILKEAEGI